MTWDELKKWAEDNFDCAIDKDNLLFVGRVFFTEDGDFNLGDVFGGCETIAINMSYEKMKQIMEALK